MLNLRRINRANEDINGYKLRHACRPALKDTAASSSKVSAEPFNLQYTKRIEEAKRLQYAPWILCKQMQRSLHSLDCLVLYYQE
ncbi:hypothetical protein [Olivibacter ginsenosidimutans]|uniref:hypothetical protein n=1 Tax=Olivibacter ginsenosidimutans TaxID=1176537 RepID=UPI0031E86F6B